MGFIAKQKTKARTAGAEYTSTLPTPWEGEGMPRMSAIVRAAACSVASGKNLRSSGFRGRDTLGIGSAMRAGESTMWYEQPSLETWTIGLGLETTKGPVLDWALRFGVQHPADGPVSVVVTTPTVLTRDGSQVHKDEYLEARELVIAGLQANDMPSAARASASASACGPAHRRRARGWRPRTDAPGRERSADWASTCDL